MRTLQEIQADVGRFADTIHGLRLEHQGRGRLRGTRAIADIVRFADTIHGLRLECQGLVVELDRDHRPPEPDRSSMVENRRAPNVSYYLQGLLDSIDDDELVEAEKKLRDAADGLSEVEKKLGHAAGGLLKVEEKLRDAATFTDESLRDIW